VSQRVRGARAAIGLDVGGTKIAGYRVDADGAVLDRVREPTPTTGEDRVVASLEGIVQRLAGPDVVAVGAGVAGLVEFATGVVRYGPNVPFRELRIRDRLHELTGLPTLVDNDANAAGWAEYRLGAGRGARDMLLVAVGTGIGGSFVSGGRLFRGAHGFAAEIGHVIVDPNGPVCGCGNRGCWEQVASGRAIGRLGRDAATRSPDSLLTELAGGDPTRITGAVVTAAGLRGDPVACGVLAEVGRRLGEGIAGLVNIVDPDVVVVGGGVMEAGDLVLEPARAACRDAIEGRVHRPDVPLVAAELGNDAGGIGAALLALEAPG
jgi:glucokinase